MNKNVFRTTSQEEKFLSGLMERNKKNILWKKSLRCFFFQISWHSDFKDSFNLKKKFEIFLKLNLKILLNTCK